MTRRTALFYLSIIMLLFLAVIGYYAASFKAAAAQPTETPAPPTFDGERAYADVQTQVDFGPRTPGSEGHTKVREWMQ